jgi:LmbE family N-acetylglucosaminyl deacetylase
MISLLTKGTKLLVISPHSDDDVIGCGGLLAKAFSLGCKAHVVVMSLFGAENHPENIVVTEDRCFNRYHELQSGYRILTKGQTDLVSFSYLGLPIGSMQQTPLRKIIGRLEAVIADFAPDIVLYCYPSHHQDHQTAYQAASAALRPRPGNTVKVTAIYEYPYIECWKPFPFPTESKVYCDIGEFLDVKLQAFGEFKSQLKADSADLLHLDSVAALAHIRGREIGCAAAEAFYLTKAVLL